LIVVAPASTAARQVAITKSGSERVASWGENSTSSTYRPARSTLSPTAFMTSSGVILSIRSIWIGDVEMNTWIRLRSAALSASAALSMSSGWVRASEAITGPRTSAAMRDTDSKSPGDEAAKPASITSTRSLASWVAMATLSSGDSAMPGACSPSRSVVSKMINRSDMETPPGTSGAGGVEPGRVVAARLRKEEVGESNECEQRDHRAGIPDLWTAAAAR
jgi:hypothetical protein